MAGEATAVIDYFYSERRPASGNLQWRVTPEWWSRFVTDLKRTQPFVPLDPVTRKVPDMIFGLPVVKDEHAPADFALESTNPFQRTLERWEAEPPGPDGTKPC